MSGFRCPSCEFDPGAHAWSGLVLARHKWEAHQIPSEGRHNDVLYRSGEVIKGYEAIAKARSRRGRMKSWARRNWRDLLQCVLKRP